MAIHHRGPHARSVHHTCLWPNHDRSLDLLLLEPKAMPKHDLIGLLVGTTVVAIIAIAAIMSHPVIAHPPVWLARLIQEPQVLAPS